MHPDEISKRGIYCAHVCSKLDRVPARDVLPHVPGFDIDRSERPRIHVGDKPHLP